MLWKWIWDAETARDVSKDTKEEAWMRSRAQAYLRLLAGWKLKRMLLSWKTNRGFLPPPWRINASAGVRRLICQKIHLISTQPVGPLMHGEGRGIYIRQPKPTEPMDYGHVHKHIHNELRMYVCVKNFSWISLWVPDVYCFNIKVWSTRSLWSYHLSAFIYFRPQFELAVKLFLITISQIKDYWRL